MEEQLISFDTAKLAKEKGFNIPCENFYIEYIDDDVADLFNYEEQRGSGYAELYRNNQEFKYSAPTQSLLQKWLREVHSIHIEVLPRYQPKKLNTEEVLYSWAISCKPFDKYDGHNDVLNHWIGIHNGAPYIEDIFYHVVKTYEEALEVGLYQALLLI